MASTWQQLSGEVSQAIDQAGKAVVAVDGRSGHTTSGIVWRNDSILTAAHAIRRDASISVILGPGRSVTGRLVGRDRGTDIAVLKLDATIDMPPAGFGNTASLSVGELTVAVARTRRGNIVGSAGIVSGLMGEWQIGRTRIDQFIRPDLTLYPGFSGGPLINFAGKVLGLNTSLLLRGRPLTIPASTLLRVAEEIASRGHVAQPYIGLVMQPVQISESLRNKAGVKSEEGLLVMHVETAGPADAAGIFIGDILVEIEGRSFSDLDDVHTELDRKGAGLPIRVSLIRGGQKMELTVQIGQRPSR
jgi:S1-C subfamily serine protease